MVPIAFGTQTSASIIRPAAFCGAVGYKPTFNLLNRAGLKFLSESLDTLGVLTRTVPDAAMIVEALSGSAPARFDEAGAANLRIGFCRTPYWNQADAATQDALEGAAPKLAKRGCESRSGRVDRRVRKPRGRADPHELVRVLPRAHFRAHALSAAHFREPHGAPARRVGSHARAVPTKRTGSQVAAAIGSTTSTAITTSSSRRARRAKRLADSNRRATRSSA